PKRSATPSTALVPQRKVGFPIPNAGLLLGFQGTKTARREGISSPFSDAGGCTSRQNSGGLLVYGYATGVFSSRKLERATYDSVSFRFIAANDHPDHDTIAAFRRRFLEEIEALFVVLQLAREMGVLKMGTVALDGTKIHANASRHSALSHEHAGKIEAH